tara:strand:- start:227 stop:406 length:180 start_codon:yes stop_codon:yes gene_type:complete
MANVKETVNKVYDNTMTYAQKIQNGIFIPKKALQNHTEVMDRLDSQDKKMDLILSKLPK